MQRLSTLFTKLPPVGTNTTGGDHSGLPEVTDYFQLGHVLGRGSGAARMRIGPATYQRIEGGEILVHLSTALATSDRVPQETWYADIGESDLGIISLIEACSVIEPTVTPSQEIRRCIGKSIG